MTKPINSYPEAKRVQVAQHRIANETCGLGFLSAVDYIAILLARAATEAISKAKAKNKTRTQ